MNNMQLKAVLALVIAAVLVVGLYAALHTGGGRGGTSNGDAIVLDTSLTTGTYVQVGSFFILGAPCTRTSDNACPTVTAGQDAGVTEQVSYGSCATATSTLFAVINPFTSATSTAQITQIYGVGNATSTDIRIGTSTQSTGLTTSLVSNTLVATTIPTSSPQFYISSGITGAAADITAGSASLSRVVVGPGKYVSGYATSTYGSAGAINYSPALTSCAYKIKWTR